MPLPPSLQANTIANYLSRAWAAVVALLFLPLYANVLGAEAYGLIGAFAILQAWALLFDFGLTPTLNREMARFRAGIRSVQSIRNLLLTLEAIATMLCACVAVMIAVLATYIAVNWLQPQALPLSQIVRGLQIMGIVVTLRWLEQLYRAALLGLQDQVWLGKAFVATETLRWAGAYAAIILVEPSVIVFFCWQAFVSIAASFVLRWRVKAHITSAGKRAHFSINELIGIRHFAGGMLLSAMLTFMLTQIDKIIVARMVPLSEFGFYMLASAAAGGLLQLILPMNQSTLPRLTEYAGKAQIEALRTLFMTSSRWMAVIIMPPCLLMAFFPEAVMLLWTGDPQMVTQVSPILPWLALGTMINGVLNTPYMLQLAYGWTSIANKSNIVAVLLLVPAAYFLVPRYGTTGAAMLFLLLNLGYLVILPGITLRKLLPGNTWTWMRSAVFLPLAATGLVGMVLRIGLDRPMSRPAAFLLLAFAGLAFFAAALWATRGPGGPFGAAKSAVMPLLLKLGARR